MHLSHRLSKVYILENVGVFISSEAFPVENRTRATEPMGTENFGLSIEWDKGSVMYPWCRVVKVVEEKDCVVISMKTEHPLLNLRGVAFPLSIPRHRVPPEGLESFLHEWNGFLWQK